MLLLGVSARSVQPSSGSADSARSVESRANRIEFLIGHRLLERNPYACGDRAGAGVAEIVDSACDNTANVRVIEDLRIEAGVTGQEEQVVSRYIDSSRPCRAHARRNVERVADRDVLQAQE